MPKNRVSHSSILTNLNRSPMLITVFPCGKTKKYLHFGIEFRYTEFSELNLGTQTGPKRG